MATAHPWFHPLIGAHCMMRWQTRRVLPPFNSPSIAVWLLTANTSSGLLLSSWTKLTGTKMGNGVGYAGASPVVMLPPSLVLPPLISTCMSSAVGFMHDARVCGGCMRVNGVNGVNGVCCAVVWRDGG